MRRLLAALLFFAAGSLVPPPLAAAAKDSSWLRQLAEARQQARAQGKLIFVDLYADWCGWCKRLEAQVFSTPKFQELAASRFVLLRLDVEDGGEGERLQASFDASSLPTALLLDPDLGLAGRIDGFLPLDAYVQQVEGQLEQREAFLARYERLRTSSDPGVLKRLAEELHDHRDGHRAAAVLDRLIETAKPKAGELGRLQYTLADSLRLSGELARAAEVNAAARIAAAERGDRHLVEACDFLAFRIAQDRGDCRTAMTTLESFVKSYPASVNSAYARRALRTLQQSGAACS